MKANFFDKEVAVYYFPVWAILFQYDFSPYTNRRILAILSVDIKTKFFDETFMGYFLINIVR